MHKGLVRNIWGSVCEVVSRQAKKCYKSISPNMHVVDNGFKNVDEIWNDISKGRALSIHWYLYAMYSILPDVTILA